MSSWARLTRLRWPPEMPFFSGEPIRTWAAALISSWSRIWSMIWRISLSRVSGGRRSLAV